MTSNVTKLHSSVKDFPARGGASLVEVNGKVLIFGGADREQTHFQDLAVYNSAVDSPFVTVKATGDIPMPRSGHAVVAYGKYMFLFGGIDFAEEAVFNDVYILNTETYEWGYVGESGVEVIARNSHSLGIISDPHNISSKHFLVIYGGASPEHGPLGDTLYAELPEVDAIDPSAIYVEWKLLPTTSTSTTNTKSTAEPSTVFSQATASASNNTTVTLPQPAAREMHGSCCFNGRMYVTGGRSESGAILSDVWVLTAHTTHSPEVSNTAEEKEEELGESNTSERGSAAEGESARSELSLASGESTWDNTPPITPTANNTPTSTTPITSTSVSIVWSRCPQLELSTPRCAHGAAVCCAGTTPSPPLHTSAVGSADRVSSVDVVSHSTAESVEHAIHRVEGSVQLVLFGGLTTSGVSGDVIATPLHHTTANSISGSTSTTSTPTSTSAWRTTTLSTPIVGRFGHSLCTLSAHTLTHITANRRYHPFISPATAACVDNKRVLLHKKENGHLSGAVSHAGLLLFGGVSIEQDFGDLHLITL